MNLKRILEPLDYILDINGILKKSPDSADYDNNKYFICCDIFRSDFLCFIEFLTIPINPEKWLGLNGYITFVNYLNINNKYEIYIICSKDISFEPEDLKLIVECFWRLYRCYNTYKKIEDWWQYQSTPTPYI